MFPRSPTAFALALLFTLARPLAAQSGPPVFENELYKTGGIPWTFATGDFDGDGGLDVAVTQNNPIVRLYKNVGSGGLTTNGTLAIPAQAAAIAAGDLSGDGKLDLTIVDLGSPVPRLSIFVGDGLSGFAAPIQYPQGQSAVEVRLADLDNNGTLDVVFANSAHNFATVLLQIVTLGFSSPKFATLTNQPVTAGATDADQDGKLDLVAISANGVGQTGFYQVLKGAGDGTFNQINSGSFPNFRAATLGDLTGDGKLDVLALTSLFGTHSYRSYVLDPSGSLGLASTGGVAALPGRANLADLTGDGFMDAVVMTADAPTLQVLSGDGTGLLTGSAPQTMSFTVTSSQVADMDGDGAVDILAGGAVGLFPSVAGFTVSSGDGSGGFPTAVPLAAGGYVWGLTALDMNHDGIPDLMETNSALPFPIQPVVNFRLGLGGATFAPPTAIPIANGSGRLAVGDFDQNGRPDIVVNHNTGTSTILDGNGDGTFNPPLLVSTGTTGLKWVLVGDVDANGFPDLLGNQLSPSLMIVVPNFGGGGFGAPSPFPTLGVPDGIAMGDLDLDGDLDVVTTSTPSHCVFLGDGAGGFTRNDIPFPVGYVFNTVAIGDLDENGIPDFATVSTDSTYLVFTGQGGGAFTAGTLQTGEGGAQDMAATDVNRDGHVDLVITHSDPPSLSVLLGDGSGTFPSPLIYTGGGNSIDLSVVDLDIDGNPDVAIASAVGKSLMVFRSVLGPVNGTSTFGTGTVGCIGANGILVNSPPAVGNLQFAVTSTNAPANALGLGAYASAPDVNGSDPLQIGLTVHLDFLTSAEVGLFDIYSDSGGNGFGPVPIPNNPFLSGLTYYLQVYWVFGPAESCDASALGFSSTPGLTLSIP